MSGQPGEARLALEWLQGTPWARAHVGEALPEALRERLERPAPRLALGQALAGVAHAALDLSDGLTGDLGHILRASGVGACIHLRALPVSTALCELPEAQRLDCLLQGGDDYELLFTAPEAAREAVVAAALRSQTPVHRIGRITAEPGLFALGAQEQHPQPLRAGGFDHFG